MANKETFVLCGVLEKGRVCPRKNDLHGACGQGGTIRETGVLVGDKLAKTLPEFDACPIALNYLLEVTSDDDSGGPVTVERSEDGKVISVTKTFTHLVNNGKIESYQKPASE